MPLALLQELVAGQMQSVYDRIPPVGSRDWIRALYGHPKLSRWHTRIDSRPLRPGTHHPVAATKPEQST